MLDTAEDLIIYLMDRTTRFLTTHRNLMGWLSDAMTSL